MFKINSNQSIFLTRGDSAKISVKVSYTDESEYIPSAGAILYFSVKKSVNDLNYVLQKILGDFSEQIEIFPADTVGLNCGKYIYDVEIHDGTDVFTIIPPTLFTLGEEVTQE